MDYYWKQWERSRARRLNLIKLVARDLVKRHSIVIPDGVASIDEEVDVYNWCKNLTKKAPSGIGYFDLLFNICFGYRFSFFITAFSRSVTD